jgi:N-acyl-D-aspartate/D-glutamate deacylase
MPCSQDSVLLFFSRSSACSVPLPPSSTVNAANQSTYTHYGITPDWHSLADYFSRIERQGMGINLASYVGAATVRRIVIGGGNRPPTPAELARSQSSTFRISMWHSVHSA